MNPRAPGNRERSGFTLLEILMVVSLMAVLSIVFLANTGVRFGFQIERSARVVAGTLQAVQQRAIATGAAHRLVLDLDEQLYRVIQKGGAATGKSPLMAAWGGVLTDDQIRDLVAYLRRLSGT